MLRVGAGRSPFGPFAIRGSFNPLDLNPIAFYNMTDLSRLWQDANRTIPATADGDPVGRVDDLVVVNASMKQGTSSDRPTLRKDANGVWHIQGDGLGDSIATQDVTIHPNFNGSVEATIFIVEKPDANPSSAAGVYTFNNYNNEGTLYMYNYTGGGRYFGAKGNQVCEGGNTGHALDLKVWTQRVNMTPGTTPADALRIRANGVDQSITFPQNNTPNLTGSTVTLMQRQLTLFKFVGTTYDGGGRVYMIIMYNYLLTDDQCAQVEAWINQQCRVY